MKTVLITGASGGIGSEIAEKFGGDYNVVINYNRSEERAQAVARAVGGFPVKADVSSPEEVAAMFKEIEERFGGVDVLINNAGVSKSQLFTDCTEEIWNEILDVNLSGVYRVTKHALPHMIRNHSGSIINISSMWGEVGASCEAAYSAAKAGVIGLTKALAKELGPSGIRVNCITPGLIDTPMNQEHDEETITVLVEETPLMRIGTPEDVGGLARFLAEESSSFITGQVIGVNGGFVI